jgi:very-short-patch-repair endonuclease
VNSRVKIPKANRGEDLFRFQCKSLKLPPFEEQYLFAKSMGREFRADFCFVEYDLIVELQGGIHRLKFEGDMRRQQYATRLGLYILPFSIDEVFSGHAVEWTEKTLRQFGWR